MFQQHPLHDAHTGSISAERQDDQHEQQMVVAGVEPREHAADVSNWSQVLARVEEW